jgi:hypothetical protein
MGEFLLSWISKTPLDQILTIGILLGSLAIVAVIIVKLVEALKKNHSIPTATLTAEGLKLGVSSEEEATVALQKEVLSPMEHKLINFFEARNREQEVEIAELRTELCQIKNELQDMRIQLGIRIKVEEDRKKNLIPFNQHTMFTNLKSSIERSIDFPDIDNDEYKRKIYISKIFIQECRSPILYSVFKDFITALEAIKNEEEKINFLFSIPDKLYEAIDEYCEEAYKKELIFNNICIIGIPRCFVEKYRQFTQPHVDLLANKIKSVLYSSFYRTWQLKLIMILDVMDTVFSLVTHELVKAINTLDGEVDKQIEEKIAKAKCQ